MAATLADLVRRFGGRLRGAGDIEITGVAALDRAGPKEISYVSDKKHRRKLDTSRAGAVIATEEDIADYRGNALVIENPKLCFARIAAFLHPPIVPAPGVHATACVDRDARISASASIGPHAVIEAGVTVGDYAEIGAGCFIGRDARIDAYTRVVGHVWIGAGCVIGKRCVLQPGSKIGGEGFGFAKDGASWVKVPQLGRVVIGDDVEIGANTTVDRGALVDTEIGDGVKLDNLIHIAHNVKIGAHTVMAACVGVAGSVTIGQRCIFGGQVGIADNLNITDDVTVLGKSLVAASIDEPGIYSSAIPSLPAERWRRNAARLRQIDEMASRIHKIEQKIQDWNEESN